MQSSQFRRGVALGPVQNVGALNAAPGILVCNTAGLRARARGVLRLVDLAPGAEPAAGCHAPGVYGKSRKPRRKSTYKFIGNHRSRKGIRTCGPRNESHGSAPCPLMADCVRFAPTIKNSMRRRRVFRAKDVKSILFGHRHPTLALHVDRQSVEQPKKPSAAGPVRYRISRAESRSLRSECNYRMQTNVPLGLRTAG